MKQILGILIIGYGSIGKNYGNYLKKFLNKYTIVVVDINEELEEIALSNNFLFFKDINSAFSTELKFDYAIVCNWGPDHLKTTKILIEKGIKKITIEKPFCNDIEEGKLVNNLLNKKNVRCNVHYRWPYLNLKNTIEKLITEYNLGKPLSLLIHGGSGGLSTGGVHWMDFSRRIFNKEPKTVISKLNINYINPRSSDLIYIDGICEFGFDDGQRLTFCLNNNSSVSLETRILFTHGYISIDSKSILKVFKRPEIEIILASKQITRYGIPELVFQNTDLSGLSSIPKVVDEMLLSDFVSDICCDSKSGLIGSAMLLTALESSKISTSLDLKNILDIKCTENWLVS